MGWKDRKSVVEALASVLVKVKALQFGSFTLSSGRLSSYYVDLRTVPSYPGAYRIVVEAFLALIKNELDEKQFDAIAGIPTAGLAFSSPIALSLQKPMVYVRRDEKPHGGQKTVEGSVRPGLRVVVLDDLITTGGTIISSVEALRREGCQVSDTVVLIDRLEGGKSNLRRNGVRLKSLTDMLELAQILHSKEVIDRDEMKAISKQIGARTISRPSDPFPLV